MIPSSDFVSVMRIAYNISTQDGAKDKTQILAIARAQSRLDLNVYTPEEKAALQRAFKYVSPALKKESQVTIRDKITDFFRSLVGRELVREKKQALAVLCRQIDQKTKNSTEQEIKFPEEALLRFQAKDFEEVFGMKPSALNQVDLALLEVVTEAFWNSNEVQKPPAGKSSYEVFKELLTGFYNGSHILISEDQFVKAAYETMIKGAKSEEAQNELINARDAMLDYLKGKVPTKNKTSDVIEQDNDDVKANVFKPVMEQKLYTMGIVNPKIAERFSSHYGPVGRFRQYQLEGKIIPATLFDVGVMAEMTNNDGKSEIVPGLYYQDIKDITRSGSKAKNEKMLKIWSRSHMSKNEVPVVEIQEKILNDQNTQARRYVNLQTEGRPDWTIDEKGKYIFSFAGLAHRVFDFVIYQYRLRRNPTKAQVGPYGSGGLPDITPIRVK